MTLVQTFHRIYSRRTRWPNLHTAEFPFFTLYIIYLLVILFCLVICVCELFLCIVLFWGNPTKAL